MVSFFSCISPILYRHCMWKHTKRNENLQNLQKNGGVLGKKQSEDVVTVWVEHKVNSESSSAAWVSHRFVVTTFVKLIKCSIYSNGCVLSFYTPLHAGIDLFSCQSYRLNFLHFSLQFLSRVTYRTSRLTGTKPNSLFIRIYMRSAYFFTLKMHVTLKKRQDFNREKQPSHENLKSVWQVTENRWSKNIKKRPLASFYCGMSKDWLRSNSTPQWGFLCSSKKYWLTALGPIVWGILFMFQCPTIDDGRALGHYFVYARREFFTVTCGGRGTRFFWFLIWGMRWGICEGVAVRGWEEILAGFHEWRGGGCLPNMAIFCSIRLTAPKRFRGT